jgi:hypothetical protein
VAAPAEQVVAADAARLSKAGLWADAAQLAAEQAGVALAAVQQAVAAG